VRRGVNRKDSKEDSNWKGKIEANRILTTPNANTKQARMPAADAIMSMIIAAW
jgi:hypothetical protein